VLVAATFACIACSLETTGAGDLAPLVGSAHGAGHAAAPSDGSSSAASGDDASASRTDDAATGDDTPHDSGPIATDAIVVAPDATYDAGASDLCDVDHDGHRARGDTCGGDDCCDYDGRSYPGQPSYFEAVDACGSFDYDCDGKSSPRYDLSACKLVLFTCSGDGFAAATACGISSDYISCEYDVLVCAAKKALRVQPCR
jgi:hypothetical protein